MRASRAAFCSTLIILVAAHHAAADVVNLNPSKDNMLIEEATGALSSGAGDYFFAGVTGQPSGSAIRRSVVAFDIAASVPAGSTINTVTLTLTQSNTTGVAATVELLRLTKNWGEGTSVSPSGGGQGAPSATGDATWLHAFFSTTSWDTPGGDFVGTASASTLVGVSAGNYQWTSAQMATDVQSWLDTPATNFGWILKATDEATQNAKRFNSRSNSGGQPVLQVDFTNTSSVESWILY